MDALSLLEQAKVSGVVVQVYGDKLVVRGPKRCETLALQLLAHKADVLPLVSLGQRLNEPVKGWEPPPRHMLEIWVDAAIPEWKRILKESISNGDRRRANYARGLLSQLGIEGC